MKTACPHDWEIGDPDEKGVSHMKCKMCGTEEWVDEKGNRLRQKGGRGKNTGIMNHNRRKKQMLAFLARRGGWMPGKEIAVALKMDRSNALHLLRTYHGEGLISQRKVRISPSSQYFHYEYRTL